MPLDSPVWTPSFPGWIWAMWVFCCCLQWAFTTLSFLLPAAQYLTEPEGTWLIHDSHRLCIATDQDSGFPKGHKGTFSISNAFLIFMWRETKEWLYLKSNKIISERGWYTTWWKEHLHQPRHGEEGEIHFLCLFHFQLMLKYLLMKRPELEHTASHFSVHQGWNCACLMSISEVIYIFETFKKLQMVPLLHVFYPPDSW